MNLLVFDRPPEPFDEQVVAPCALAVHADGDLVRLQQIGEAPLMNWAYSTGSRNTGFLVRFKVIVQGLKGRFYPCKLKRLRVTLCRLWGTPLLSDNPLFHKNYLRFRALMHSSV